MTHPKDLSDFYHAFNSTNIQYFESLKKFLLLTRNIKGEILEFGVGRGRSLIATCHIIHQYKLKKKFTAFDSFERGFGIILNKDNSFRNPKKKDWTISPNGQFKYTMHNIKKILNKHIDRNNFIDVKFVEGFVEKSLPKYSKNIKRISFINLDIDLYSGHKIILEHTFEKLSKGGIIYFDDIYPKEKKNEVKFPGARTAFKEFFKNKKIKKYICDFRQNLIIQKL